MEDVGRLFKKYGATFLIILALFLGGYILIVKINIMDSNEEEIWKSSEIMRDSVYEKGYNLPIEDAVRKESEMDCAAAMESILDIYWEADKGSASNVVISNETARSMLEVLKGTGRPVTGSGHTFNMANYKKMETFLIDSLNGKKGEIVTYRILSSGGIGREKYIFDGTDMFILTTVGTWSDKGTQSIMATSYTRIKKWDYTQKGWFRFEYCVPESPEFSALVHANAMSRVKPIEEKYIKIAEKYLRPLGYQGNNLLWSNWDAEHMEEIDYNGLFEYLFFIKHGQPLNQDAYAKGIPEKEFESLMIEYLPVTAEQLKSYGVYDAESQTYAWEILGRGNYVPDAFGSSTPEITGIKENQDGTVTLMVDVICETLGEEDVINHQVTVQFKEDGSVYYLSNQVLNNKLEKILEYQYRFKR